MTAMILFLCDVTSIFSMSSQGTLPGVPCELARWLMGSAVNINCKLIAVQTVVLSLGSM